LQVPVTGLFGMARFGLMAAIAFRKDRSNGRFREISSFI
jgi:hypothetical protein